MKRLPSIYVTRPFPGPAIDIFRREYDLLCNPNDTVLTKSQLMKAVKGVDVIVSLLTDKIDAEVMDAAGPQLKLIANYAIGFDNIDIQAAKERDIVVTNAAGDFTGSIAEHTFALILSVARYLREADRFMRQHRYKQWEPALFLGLELQGKTLGIVGLGLIGISMIRIAKGFGMNVVYTDAIRNKKHEEEFGVTYKTLEELLTESDIVSLHVPLIPTTRHLMNEKTLAMMKPSAILVNTARGPVVSEKALVHALKKKQIFGAALDVFEDEPKISDELAKLPNVILTPHIASSTIEARNMMSQIVADNVVSFLEKGKAITPVY